MVYLLAAMRIAVDDQPVAVFRYSFFPGKIARHDHHVSYQGLILIRDVVGRGNHFIRNDEDMHRCRRTNVEEGKKLLRESGLPVLTANDIRDAAQKAVAAATGK